MLSFKYLFENPSLAKMLLENWEYDPDSTQLFQYFRISANAIYPFKHHQQVCFLRFSPGEEKTTAQLQSELEFLRYLHTNHYPALRAIPAKSGEEFIERQTPWGPYIASAFRRVSGTQLSDTGFEDYAMAAYGEALGRLHRLSSQFVPAGPRRWAHGDVLDWVEATLKDLKTGDLPLREADLLREAFSRLPISARNYGLIHYDFEPDNIFFDEQSGTCSVIDFDDAMVHWYAMDLTQALRSLRSEVSEEVYPRKEAQFLEGYRSQFEIEEETWRAAPLFTRFAKLYQYARVAWAMREQWDNEPEWMQNLRAKLNGLLARNAEGFGQAIGQVKKFG